MFNSQISKEGWRIDVRFEADSLIFCNGLKYLQSDEDFLLAICLNNGYYKRENIYRMIKFALNFSKRVQIFTTDGPAKHNHYALGESETKTARETRLDRNHLRNLCRDGLERINADLPATAQRTLTFLEWNDIYQDRAYIDNYAEVKTLYNKNKHLQNDVQDNTRQVLSKRMGIQSSIDSALAIGIEYTLEELAFILSYSGLNAKTKPIPDHGANKFNYTYYEPWIVLENYVNGAYGNKPREGIGFVITKITGLDVIKSNVKKQVT